MQYITKLKLAAMHQLCDAEDRSTEYTIQFLQNMCKVSHDTVMDYLMLSNSELTKLRKDVNSFVKMFADAEEILN
jgi:uncharacterized protein YeeX (DUF496 family)